ncbi:glycosyltransferase family 4 protein [Tropicibacter sp. Alg240-R139]|uniref:glycosyltransferase family 4 protein n=1 Tax=Tropicibacter sp. Alg240-R139 TaxID=2305991 RepID=UPI0013DEC4DB|nr:glycosyltransferase family 4 protein [Tropicibacter sp. Alg240-R139]
MNILFLVSSLQGGGAERVAALLSNAWVDRGHDVTLMPTFSGRGECSYTLNSGVVVDYLADHVNGNTSKLQRLVVLRRHIRKTRPDVIVSFLPNVNIAALAATIRTNIPVIACERIHPPLMSPPLPRSYELVRKWLYPRAACVGVQTQTTRDWVAENIACAKLSVIANPVVLPLPAGPSKLSPDNILAKERKLVLAVGRLHATKRLDMLIQAFQRAQPESEWDLVILGEGEHRSEYVEGVAAAGWADRIHLPGFVGNLADWYTRADIFAMPSSCEGFPNVLLEAMAHDLPSISFDIPAGPRDLTDGGQRGILLPDQDHVPSMTTALQKLMQDPDQRQQLGGRAGEVRDIYGLETILGQWDDCLADALASTGTSGT